MILILKIVLTNENPHVILDIVKNVKYLHVGSPMVIQNQKHYTVFSVLRLHF